MNISKIIRRFFTGKISAEEHALLSEWKDDSVKNIEELQNIIKLQALDLKDYQSHDVSAAWKEMEEMMGEQSPKVESPTKVRSLWSSYAAAAVFLLVAGAGLFFVLGNDSKANNTQQYVTQQEGQEVNLADGSLVSMDKSSSLDLNSTREVSLEGRAYFDIAKDKSQPFIVHTNTGKIEVLGTEFSVVSDSASTEVYVTEGRVRYTDDHRSLILNVGDYIRAEGKDVVKVKKEEGNYLSWHKNKLKFRNTSLAEAIQDIESFYNIDIEIAPSVKNKDCRITSTYKGRSAKEVLNELRDVLGLKYNKKGSTIVIVDSKC